MYYFLRNQILNIGYKLVVKPIFFQLDPEYIHDKMIKASDFCGSNWLLRNLLHLMFYYENPILTQNIKGINFKNPVGLAAGFDKDALATNILYHIGFGFEEVGSVTGEPCAGNPGKRLWRLPKSKSLVVYYGLKNMGAKVISQRLSKLKFKMPIGINIAKTNCKETVDLEKGIQDYVKAYKAFKNIGDYYTINISCPNAFGGQPFTDKIKLAKLLSAIDKEEKTKPIFLKLSPDLSNNMIDDLIEVSREYKIDGFVCSNLTKNRESSLVKDKVPDVGGLSGKVTEELSNKLISYIYSKTKGEFVIIGCGGIFNSLDAYKKIKCGASLVQLITGMIYEGPQLMSEINRGLVQLVKKDGYKNISEAIGKSLIK